MANRGIQEFYYTRKVPSRAIKIAEVRTSPFTPAQLVDISNTPHQEGTLGVWNSTSNLAGAADFIAPDFNQAIAISGTTLYYVENQFFELTNQSIVVDGDTIPLFFQHRLPANVTDVRILDLDDVVQTDAIFNIVGQSLYHDLDEGIYRVRYIDAQGFLRVQLLQYKPVLSEAPYAPSATTFVYAARTLTTNTVGTQYIRFKQPNGYLLKDPYDTLPNTPWFPRVGFGLQPIAPEWARQLFLPQRPFMFASWVPGKVLDTNLIEFERKQMFYDPEHLPDILIFDKDYAIKYALEGTKPGSPRRRGGLYPWKRGLIKEDGIDAYNSRVEIALELAPDDIIFGFYSYREQDVIYSALDVNPYTNPDVKNRAVKFYFKSNGSDPFRYIYHQILDDDGSNIAGLTNDPVPGTGTNIEFGRLVVGANVGPASLDIFDERELGGGLMKEHQTIPESVHFWDLGFIDGKPYPAGGGLIVHLPSSILERMSQSDVENRVRSVLPLGVLPVIFYYDSDGAETR
jgi:hypothetical protein